MKTTLLLIAAAGAIGFVTLYVVRRVQSRKMRGRVAAEGFETATDVLYPNKRRMFSKYRIGPILPQ